MAAFIMVKLYSSQQEGTSWPYTLTEEVSSHTQGYSKAALFNLWPVARTRPLWYVYAALHGHTNKNIFCLLLVWKIISCLFFPKNH